MLKNKRKVSTLLLEIVGVIWLCAEIGQFIQTRVSWGQSELFWPLWVCFSLVIILSAKLIDAHFRN